MKNEFTNIHEDIEIEILTTSFNNNDKTDSYFQYFEDLTRIQY